MTDIAPLVAELRELLAEDDDHMVASGEDLAWLIEQSLRWPIRVHPERTTNDRFLRFSMAATLLDALTNSAAYVAGMREAACICNNIADNSELVSDAEEARVQHERGVAMARQCATSIDSRAYAIAYPEDAKPTTPSGSATLDECWRCPACQSCSRSRVATRRANGSFGPGPDFRCDNCKRVFSPGSGTDEEVERVARAVYQAHCGVHDIVPEWGRGGFKTQILEWQAIARAALSARPDTTDVRENLRLLMLEQNTTGERRTYTDGFAQGLCEAIRRLDAADTARSGETEALREALEAVREAIEDQDEAEACAIIKTALGSP